MSKLKAAIIKKIPYVGSLYKSVESYKQHSCYRPGHYYSPLVSLEDIEKRADKIWPVDSTIEYIEGINLNTEQQLQLVKQLSKYYNAQPFRAEASKCMNTSNRYYFNNDYYSYTDGIVLYSMMRHFQPKNIIEIGSGFSSALMLDVNQKFFANTIKLKFIEPYAERLFSLMSTQDKKKNQVITKPIQDVDVNVFKDLDSNDILFIDSTHVVKTGSDVNFVFFEILPLLKPGVLIHFHDIFYPFEYPKQWVFKGRNWNENYFLRSFLMYNNKFKMILFADYLHKRHQDCFKKMPLAYNNTGGNIWLQVE